jgi:hypothetical protein
MSSAFEFIYESKSSNCKLPESAIKPILNSIPFEHQTELSERVPDVFGFDAEHNRGLFIKSIGRESSGPKRFALVCPQWSTKVQFLNLGFSFSDQKQISDKHLYVAFVVPSMHKRTDLHESRSELVKAIEASATEGVVKWQQCASQVLKGTEMDVVWYERKK